MTLHGLQHHHLGKRRQRRVQQLLNRLLCSFSSFQLRSWEFADRPDHLVDQPTQFHKHIAAFFVSDADGKDRDEALGFAIVVEDNRATALSYFLLQLHVVGDTVAEPTGLPE